MKPKQIIHLILIIFWMIAVFMFSHESAEKSKKTSNKTLDVIIEAVPPLKEKASKDITFLEKCRNYIRKIAHYLLYTLGGVLIFSFITTFNISLRLKAIYVVGIGAFYALTDEIHQIFIPR